MTDDLEQMIKERLLEDLINKMSDKRGEGLAPKGMAVQVAAPDKEKLAEGLDKAKEELPHLPEASEGDEAEAAGHEGAGDGQEDDDEQRLLALLGEHDEDDDEGKRV